jgi:hypothetical protein
MRITVAAIRRLTREILPYALLGVIDLWWLYGWHVGGTALFAFCSVGWFAWYEKGVASPSEQCQARDHV